MFVLKETPKISGHSQYIIFHVVAVIASVVNGISYLNFMLLSEGHNIGGYF